MQLDGHCCRLPPATVISFESKKIRDLLEEETWRSSLRGGEGRTALGFHGAGTGWGKWKCGDTSGLSGDLTRTDELTSRLSAPPSLLVGGKDAQSMAPHSGVLSEVTR